MDMTSGGYQSQSVAPSESLSKSRLRNIISAGPAVIYTSKPYGNFPCTFVSDNIRDVLGYEPWDFIINPGFWSERVHPCDRDRVFRNLKLIFKVETLKHDYRFLHRDGRYRWLHDRLTVVRFPNGEPREIVGHCIDVSDRMQAEKKLAEVNDKLKQANRDLEKLALVDPLTELLNRRGIQQALTREMQVARRRRANLLAMLVDLDDFKRINDSLGHAVGDIVLKEVARKLKRSLRAHDHLARIGGDEFMVLLPFTKAADRVRIAEKIRSVLSTSPISLSSGPVEITASVGVIELGDDVASIDEVLSESHFVIHESKKSGKNRVTYSWGGKQDCNRQNRTVSELLDGLRRGTALRAVKLPIVQLSNEKVVGHEFLTRSTIPGFEMPDDFFRVSTEEKMLTLVDHQCFRRCMALSASVKAGLRRHVNILPSTLIDVPVQELLKGFPDKVPRRNFCVEISEQQIIGDPSYLIEPVRAFKEAGIMIAFDDVGFGRSWLESLILLEPDMVKIDRGCVSGISGDPHKIRALERLLKVVNSLGARAIAEGIETREDLRMLRKLGVKFGQGFLWGKPGVNPA